MAKHSEFSDDPSYAKTVARKLLNRHISDRLISKQECMVMIGNMHLTICSESIESISISSACRIKMDQANNGKSLMQRHMKRENMHSNLSFDEFFHLKKNQN